VNTARPSIAVAATREEAGAAAGRQAADVLRAAVSARGSARVIFASAPSQQEMITTLAGEDLDWGAVRALHMDEYVGLPADHPQSFGQWLLDRLPTGIGEFDRIRPGTDPETERRRYAELLRDPVDLVCMGIGVNGHIAFNEPGADFDDAERVRLIQLDPASRTQQVDDGCFAELSEVPTSALTITIGPLVSAGSIVCTVVGSRQAAAVAAALSGPIGPDCPASILQRCPQAGVFLDEQAAAELPRRRE
jgi:glucosamine-6-phosphate deaminase